MNWAAGALEALWQYAGFVLVWLLVTEEFTRLVGWFKRVTREQPRLKILFYPLAVALILLTASLIVNSFVTLFLTVLFSYD